MTERALILANGKGKRFGEANYKQFLTIGDELLLNRMIRQLCERGIRLDEIYVFSRHYPVMACAWIANCRAIDPGITDFMLLTFQEAMKWWGDKNYILLGDVVWSDRAMDLMFVQDRFRRVGSKTKHGGEGYGWVALKSEREWLRPHMEFAIHYIKENGSRPGDGGWQMYRSKIGADPERHVYDDQIFLDLDEILDWTQDFDYPEDYEEFVTGVKKGEIRL